MKCRLKDRDFTHTIILIRESRKTRVVGEPIEQAKSSEEEKCKNDRCMDVLTRCYAEDKEKKNICDRCDVKRIFEIKFFNMLCAEGIDE